MNNFDDIFDTAVPGEQPFDKDAWAERKQAERQAVYDLADAIAAEVCADGEKFHAYLDTQAHFDRYSVTNVLLIMAQMPTATQIKDFEAWKAAGASIKRQQRGFDLYGLLQRFRDGNFIGFHRSFLLSLRLVMARPRRIQR